MNPFGEPWGETGPLLCLDTETTGTDPTTDRIVTAALLLDIPGQPERSWEWLVNPGVPIHIDAIAVHGISQEHAEANGMLPKQFVSEIIDVLSDLEAKIPGLPLVVYSASFDLTLLSRAKEREGFGPYELTMPVIDPLCLDRALDTYRPGRKTQTAISAAYGLTVSMAHQAIGDARSSVRLTRAIIKRYPWVGNCPLDKLQRYQQIKHKEWCEQFAEYRRREDPSFTIETAWPIIPGEVTV